MKVHRKYILLCSSIVSVGGAQIYASNKIKFLTEQGWSIAVYSFSSGTPLLSDLENQTHGMVSELGYPPFYFSKKERESIIHRVAEGNKGFDSIIIESNTQSLAFWGEMLARELGGKHIVFLVNEYFPHLSVDDYRFFIYKQQRRELAGINKLSLKHFFRGHADLLEHERRILPATNAEVVQDVENQITDRITRKDINIGCITRLEKNYVFDLIKEIISFAKQNEDKSVQLVFIGGAQDAPELEKKVKAQGKNTTNLNIIVTGFLYPIPRKIFKLMDVFIGVAGASKLPAWEGIPTISLDVLDGKPIGILGYDAGNSFYRETKNQLSISQLLQKMFIDKTIDLSLTAVEHLKRFDDIKLFFSHLQFIEESEQAQQYYNFASYRLNFPKQMGKLIFRFLGARWYARLFDLYLRGKSRFTIVPR